MYVTGHCKAFEVLRNNPSAYQSGMAWLKIVQHEDTLWSNLHQVKQVIPTVEWKFPYTVFPLMGGQYRIITEIQYKSSSIQILKVVTFDEYKQ